MKLYLYQVLFAIALTISIFYYTKRFEAPSNSKPSRRLAYVACLNAHFAELGRYYARYEHKTSQRIASWNRPSYEQSSDLKIFSVSPSHEAKDSDKLAIYAFFSTGHYNATHPVYDFIGMDKQRYEDFTHRTIWRMMAFSSKSDMAVASRSCSTVLYNGNLAHSSQNELAVKCEFPRRAGLRHSNIERVQLTGFALNGDANTFASPSVRLCDHSGVFKKVNMAMCLHVHGGDVDKAKQWIVYHLSIGFELIVMYVAQSNEGYAKFVNTYSKMFGDALVLINMNIDGAHGRLLQYAAQQECIFRMRGIARWLALGDIDEYFAPVGKSSQRPLLDVLESAHKRIGPSLGAVYFPQWLMAPINVTGMPNINITDKVQLPNIDMSGSVLRMRAWKWRVSRPWFDWGQKSIVRPENVDYFTVHQIDAGGPNYTCDPFNECAMMHYRFPPRVVNTWKGPWFTAEYYPILAETIGEKLAQILKNYE